MKKKIFFRSKTNKQNSCVDNMTIPIFPNNSKLSAKQPLITVDCFKHQVVKNHEKWQVSRNGSCLSVKRLKFHFLPSHMG